LIFRRIAAVSIVLTLLFFYIVIPAVSAPAALPDDEAMDFVWWRITGQGRTPDGGMTVDLELIGPDGALDDAEVAYKSTPRHGSGGASSYGPVEAYRKKFNSPFSIYSGRTERIELMASVLIEGRKFYASAAFSCYGESGRSDQDSERVDTAPGWPSFHLVTDTKSQIFYRAQTGTPVTLSIEGSPSSVIVFEKGVPAAAFPGQSGTYSYTPPHDRELAESGYSAKNDLVFAASLPDGSVTSFYVPVFRAFYGQINLAGGLAVLASGALLSLGLVWRAGRRFPWR
jgi:hypothetical protein